MAACFNKTSFEVVSAGPELDVVTDDIGVDVTALTPLTEVLPV